MHDLKSLTSFLFLRYFWELHFAQRLKITRKVLFLKDVNYVSIEQAFEFSCQICWFLGHMGQLRQFSLFWTKVILLVNFNFGHHVSDWTIDSLFQSPVTQSRWLLFHPKLRRRRRIFLHLYLISFAMPYPETVGAKTHCAKMEFILYWLQE